MSEQRRDASTVPSTAAFGHELSVRAVFALFLLAAALALLVVVTFSDYRTRMYESGDKPDYARISKAIREGNLSQRIARKYFWGLPATSALVATATRMDDTVAILSISTVASIGAVFLAFRLWGGRIAALFAIASPDWIQKVVLGGVEPFFVVLLFAGFWAARRERWLLSSFLLSYATIVRPVGVFALLAIGIELLRRRDGKRFAVAAVTSLLIAAAYAGAGVLLSGDARDNYRAYRVEAFSTGSPVTVPFGALVPQLLASTEPLTNRVKNAFWVVLTVVSAAIAVRWRTMEKLPRFEVWFAALYAAFLVTFNSPFAWTEYPRFMIPILPFIWIALQRWLPLGRWFYWTLAVGSGLFSGVSAVGFRNVASLIR